MATNTNSDVLVEDIGSGDWYLTLHLDRQDFASSEFLCWI